MSESSLANKNMGSFVYTQDEKDIVVKAYHETPVKDIAMQIEHSYDSVCHLIRRLKKNGVICESKRGFKPHWTEEELTYLSDNWGLKPTKAIAKAMRRTVCGVEGKAHRLRLRKVDSFYTYNLLSQEIGKSRMTLRKYHRNGWIKGKKALWVASFGVRPMMSFEEDIVKFLREHYKLFKVSQILNPYFKNIVKECYE